MRTKILRKEYALIDLVEVYKSMSVSFSFSESVRFEFIFFPSPSDLSPTMQKDFGEKPSVMMVEDIGIDDDLSKPQVKKDYSGVAAKTDPAEIALVKKLDRWIMPMLWCKINLRSI
jgi:hypothetical protein